MILTELQLQAVMADSRYHDLGALPSQGNAYDWDKMFIRPFEVLDFKLVSKASMLKEMSHMIRAIDLVCTQDAGNLTIGDFYYTMMWLRIHSLPKSPLIVDWYCNEDVLRHKTTGEYVHNGENFQAPTDIHEYESIPCDTQNTESLHMVSTEIISLPDKDEQIAALKEGETWKPLLPDWADWPRARHIDAIAQALADPELTMLAGAAQWYKGETFADRMNAMFDNSDGMANERLVEAQAFNETYMHGLKEHTTLSCRTCRIKVPYTVTMTPLHFFP